MIVTFVVPHMLRDHGGLNRFVEIGNGLMERGHSYNILIEGRVVKSCELYKRIKGNICSKKDAYTLKQDIVVISDPIGCVTSYEKMAGKKYVYVIAEGEYTRRYQEYAKHYPVLVNNKKFLQVFSGATLVEGGLSDDWKPRTLHVAYFRKKGLGVEQQLGHLKHINLVPLELMCRNEQLWILQSADYFASWETTAGWSNMSARALACGLPVVTNGVGCEPFIEKCIVVKDLRDYFDDPLKGFKFKDIINNLLQIWEKSLINTTK